jgi:hypothetical protein
VVAPLGEIGVCRQGAIIRFNGESTVVDFEDAAGLELSDGRYVSATESGGIRQDTKVGEERT